MTNMTNIYECCSIANDALYLPCVVSLTNSKNDVCTRTHTQKITTGHAHSAYHSFISFVVFCCLIHQTVAPEVRSLALGP